MGPVIIIGGGIVGASVAYALRDASTDVQLLEKDSLGSGTTSKSISVFSWLKDEPSRFQHSLMERSWETYADLIEDDTITYEEIGAMIVSQTESYRSKLESAAETLREFGVNAEVIPPTDLDAFGVEPSEATGALYTPDEGYLDPHEIIQYWIGEARSAGVDVRTGVEVTGIRTEDGAVSAVETRDAEIAVDTVINTAGPWAPRVNAMVDVSLPLRHTPGRILVLQVDDELSLPYTLFESGDYFRSEGRNQAFAGRLEKEYDSATEVNPDEARSIEESFYHDVATNTSTLVPALAEAEIVNEWVGLRTVTPDKKPIVDTTTVDGFLVACGMSGLGVTYAPVVGELISGYLDTGEKTPELEGLSAARFE